jgi:phosphatidylglycerol:prolipoprotein diacylglycerol transferase
MIVVAVVALIGGRLYHVIDQWQLYKDDLAKIILPPYSGLGVYGGIFAGTIAAFLYIRAKHQPFLSWADAVAPGLFAMQAIARWGNFFNQELYGSPTNLPWGIAIECQYRTQGYPCPPGSDPTATLGQHFQPMFLYESLSGLVGMLVLVWLARRFATRLRPGDLLLIFFIWYGTVRFWRGVAQGRQRDILRGACRPDHRRDHGRRSGRHPGCPPPARRPAAERRERRDDS